MEYYFKKKNGETLRLAIPLAEIPEIKSVDIQKSRILEKGEVSFFAGRNLDSIKINSFFPSQNYSFCVYSDFPSTQESKNFFVEAMETGEEITFIVTETDINKEYFIKSFESFRKQGRKDLYFNLELIEAVSPEISYSKEETLKRKTKNTAQNSKKYIIKKGDTLSRISHKFYGSTKNQELIFNANKEVIKNKSILLPGIEVVLP